GYRLRFVFTDAVGGNHPQYIDRRTTALGLVLNQAHKVSFRFHDVGPGGVMRKFFKNKFSLTGLPKNFASERSFVTRRQMREWTRKLKTDCGTSINAECLG